MQVTGWKEIVAHNDLSIDSTKPTRCPHPKQTPDKTCEQLMVAVSVRVNLVFIAAAEKG